LLFVCFLVNMETSNRYRYLLIIKEGWIKPIFSRKFMWVAIMTIGVATTSSKM
jgi:hypothetical protein